MHKFWTCKCCGQLENESLFQSLEMHLPSFVRSQMLCYQCCLPPLPAIWQDLGVGKKCCPSPSAKCCGGDDPEQDVPTRRAVWRVCVGNLDWSSPMESTDYTIYLGYLEYPVN